MEVWEKINYIMQEKEINKKDFVKQLLQLEPKLKTTGEIPSEQTIYRYLNGQREIKVELIPYIAEVLGVDEGELFRFDIEYASEYNIRYSKDAREILELLQYLPKPTLEHMKSIMQRFKKEHKKTIQEFTG
jgi:transcriptional regulator with XRE-family HTH domain